MSRSFSQLLGELPHLCAKPLGLGLFAMQDGVFEKGVRALQLLDQLVPLCSRLGHGLLIVHLVNLPKPRLVNVVLEAEVGVELVLRLGEGEEN